MPHLIFRWFRDDAPDAALWRSTLMFIALDVFFTGLVGAYVYQLAGVAGVLALIVGQQASTIVGHLGANWLMRHPSWPAMRTQRVGVAGLGLVLLGAGLVSMEVVAAVVWLAVGGGLARGVTYGARLWMEARLPAQYSRQNYLSMVEASGVVLKICAPLVALLVLSFTPRFEVVFLVAGVAFLLALLVTRPAGVEFGAPGPLHLLGLMRDSRYWANAPYYLIEGAGHALRTALFVSGAMAVVGSLKGYAWVEVGASVLAAGLLVLQTRAHLPEPSLRALRGYLLMLGGAWLTLLVAFVQPAFLPVFVALYALSFPLVTAQKSGITLGGIVKAPGSLESNLMGRAVLLTSSRVGVLALFLFAYFAGVPQSALLVAMATSAVLLLPLEYWTARRLHTLPAKCA